MASTACQRVDHRADRRASRFVLRYQERYSPNELGKLFSCCGRTLRDRSNEPGGLPFSRSGTSGNYWISYDRLVSYLRGRKPDDPIRLLLRHIEPAPESRKVTRGDRNN
jgi:hypothetical protein